MPFPKVLMWSGTQTAFWTLVADPISMDDNRYANHVSINQFSVFKVLHDTKERNNTLNLMKMSF